ncbi:hypothetical protein B0H16DRAFT_1483273 [Mycena metata]|uniref:Uncharacterized protein n=1 Tax=Mycena metata TaxID=1033252 RepID=A0AAD7DYW3_9AGAR|nr:hypothetical protein B0H16DRAFT_1483273 [Mycena metata]
MPHMPSFDGEANILSGRLAEQQFALLLPPSDKEATQIANAIIIYFFMGSPMLYISYIVPGPVGGCDEEDEEEEVEVRDELEDDLGNGREEEEEVDGEREDDASKPADGEDGAIRALNCAPSLFVGDGGRSVARARAKAQSSRICWATLAVLAAAHDGLHILHVVAGVAAVTETHNRDRWYTGVAVRGADGAAGVAARVDGGVGAEGRSMFTGITPRGHQYHQLIITG